MVSGGFDYEFVPELPDYFVCVVCHLALKKPIQVEECGHRLCEWCFEDIKNHVTDGDEMQCPIDRQMFLQENVFKDKGSERIILNWKVKCQNHQKGCDWVGELNTVENHSKECNFREKENNSAPEKIRDLKQHLTEMEKTMSTEIKDIKNQINDLRKDFSSEIKQLKDLFNQIKEESSSRNNNRSVTGPGDLKTLTMLSDSKWEWKCPVFTERETCHCSPVFYCGKWCFQLWMECKEKHDFDLGFYLCRVRGIYDHQNKFLENNVPADCTILLSMKCSLEHNDFNVDLSNSPWTIKKGFEKSVGHGSRCKDGFNYINDGFYHITCKIIKKRSSDEPSTKRSKK